jgi:6-phosphofructokinase 1
MQGTLLLNAGIGAGAEEILIPEENLGLDRLLESLQKSKALANHPVLL